MGSSARVVPVTGPLSAFAELELSGDADGPRAAGAIGRLMVPEPDESDTSSNSAGITPHRPGPTGSNLGQSVAVGEMLYRQGRRGNRPWPWWRRAVPDLPC